MTESRSMETPPAGWYENPANPTQQRWWDGAGWTDQTSAPAYSVDAPVAQLRAPIGTNPNTVWIWLTLAVPLLRLVPFFTWDLSPMSGIGTSTDSSAILEAQLAFLMQPAYAGSLLVSFLIMSGAIVFAVLDWRALRRKGVPVPFHWAFAFTAVITVFCVYPIGRAIVARRRTGRRSAVLVVAIVVQVALLAAPINNALMLSGAVFG